MVEKVVRSLQDLEEAIVVAAQEGGCRIRVGEHVAALVSTDDVPDEEAERFLNHPVVVERLERAMRSLAEGRGIPHEQVLSRLEKR